MNILRLDFGRCKDRYNINKSDVFNNTWVCALWDKMGDAE